MRLSTMECYRLRLTERDSGKPDAAMQLVLHGRFCNELRVWLA